MRRNQSVTIAALIIAIVGLSIGFAAFSNTLTIRSSATLNPDSSTFRVVFSKSSSAEVVGEEHSVAPNNNTYGDGATIDNATQGESILKDLHAKFTEPNQTVKYNLYVYNAGSYQAQLTGITFKNVTGESAFKKCTATTKQDTTQMATQSLVNSACEGISISVKVGNKVARPGDESLNYQILDSHTSLPVEVTITYAEGSAYADGDFEVEFGDIEITATSAVDPERVVATNPWRNRGLTSNNVVFDKTYGNNEIGEIFIVHSDGALTFFGNKIESDDVDSIINNSIIVGENYFATGGTDKYAFVFGSNNEVTMYGSSTNELSLQSIVSNSNGNSKLTVLE